MSREINFEYKGYTVESEYEIEADGDNAKIFYDCKDSKGERVSFDWTPYDYPTFEDFSTWVDLGCPARIGCGPLNSDSLLKIAKR